MLRYRRLQAVLKDKAIKGVVIAAPTVFHYEIASKALNAGKHVFVEKPLSLNQADGEKLVRLAAEKNKIFLSPYTALSRRHYPLKEMIKKGKIGSCNTLFPRLSFGKIGGKKNPLVLRTSRHIHYI
jgi:UDP-2-acetamido-3-amino-2,3-dideoxy-glucuronate N-acetyltransferase